MKQSLFSICFILFFFVQTAKILAQEQGLEHNQLLRVIPKSPNSATFDEYIKNPVSMSTGHFSIYWAYNSQYPVVKAENVSYDSLIVAISAALPTGYSGLDELHLDIEGPEDIRFKNFNDNLRDHPLLNKGTITTYTYLPLLGVTSQTDPNGLTTYYEYDGLGRLIKVLDNDRNVLQEYKYNYANQ